MKQILQDIKKGHTILADVPVPKPKRGMMLIKTRASLISSGTEKMLIDFGRANYLDKARQQPEKVKMVLDKIRTDGIIPTVEAVRSKLNQPLPLGYCNAGVIESSGDPAFKEGDRVVSNGPHAEYVRVGKNLCAKIPENVRDEEAVFAVPGAIALQGIRLAGPELGETFAVIGLGLIGQLAVQLLIANGCNVVASDVDPEKCRLAETFGAVVSDISQGGDIVEAAVQISGQRGIDGVIITAATSSDLPVHQAAQMCRKRGRIILVGTSGLKLNRSDFYEKEISFQVSCSYGPGRYDSDYEEKGNDYPFGFVRWTEQRNFDAVLELISRRQLDIASLISHRFDILKATSAYEILGKADVFKLGVILNYSDTPDKTHGTQPFEEKNRVDLTPRKQSSGLNASVIGAGGYTGQVFLPALKKTGVSLRHIASGQGVSSTHWGKKFGFETSVTDPELIFSDPDTSMVFINTRHDSHVEFVLDALNARKHVYVEKPLCLTLEQLSEIEDTYGEGLMLMVGFNRRFAPHIEKIKLLTATSSAPKSFIMTVNAGAIPYDHWTQDPHTGGGRIIGEACHFVDLLRFLAGGPIVRSAIEYMPARTSDTASIQLSFEDGSIGTIHYFANGNKGFPKERLEVFCDGKILEMDNYKNLKGYGWDNFKSMRTWRQDKGHANALKAFVSAAENDKGIAPIPFEEILEVSKISIELAAVR